MGRGKKVLELEHKCEHEHEVLPDWLVKEGQAYLSSFGGSGGISSGESNGLNIQGYPCWPLRRLL